jgi:predicted kinase
MTATMNSPLSRKVLFQMSGAPGSGKSTVANLLAKAFDGVVINHDLIKAFFLENNMGFGEAAKLTYSFDWVLAEDMIKQGRSVIIDTVCNYDEVLIHGTALAQKYGYEYRYVECRVKDFDLLDQRLRTRVSLRSQRTAIDRPSVDAIDAHYHLDSEALFKKWVEHPRRPATNVIVVDSTQSPEQCLKYIQKQIGHSLAENSSSII